MRALGVLPIVLLAAGAGLVALAVLTGGAAVGVVLIVPFVVGRSIDLGLGVLLLIVGFLTLPLVFLGSGAALEEEPDPRPSSGPRRGTAGNSGGGTAVGSEGGSGGIIIVGPIPILFGSWRNVSPRTRTLIAAAAAAVFVAVVVLFLISFR